MLEFAVDGIHGKDGVLAHVRVPVLEARAAGRDERLEELCVLGDLLEEAERRATDVLVGMLLNVPCDLVEAREYAGKVLTRSLRIALLHVKSVRGTDST